MTTKNVNIHMIDDDEAIFELLNDYFETTPYNLTYSESPSKGLTYIKNNPVDLAILDLMLPEMDGFELCKKVREINNLLPIIMLTAKKDDFDKILGLELGADDYISKPFNPRELVARIKTIFRRLDRVEKLESQVKNENTIVSTTWDIVMNLDSRTVTCKNEIVDLTSTEFDILRCLMENAGVVQTRDNLMDKVKGIDFDSFDRTIDVFISKIRQKIHDNSKKQEIIKTVRNVGYIFNR
ncbi:MAG: response regulator transcription factor [Candidatus Sericytochromatia bacterium]